MGSGHETGGVYVRYTMVVWAIVTSGSVGETTDT